ncbi:transcription initiation factor IIB [Nanobdella aerobiophila]|uniref:Transcription initiation factor IIB n=1 Tax=Nanobdella aerobiophila TaxID=2586965 RepID=A0A915WSJ3_9ARCH|nr:TFIIB-type zinc ribbon-containing protein [Nanobdella aerobiophila]BBL45267.1 transcription initiation factor IIB [Nanobdella aerobiophila]
MVQKLIKKEELKCPVCGGTEFVYNEKTAELICTKCGYVMEEVPYLGKEYRTINNEDVERRSRTGSAIKFSNMASSLSTEIGRVESGEEDYSLTRKLKKWQQRSTSSYERNLKLAQQELKRISSFLQLPKQVEETALKLYLEAVEKGLIRGRSVENVVASCVYIACRIHDVARTIDEIIKASNIHKKELGRTYKHLLQALKIKITPIEVTEYVHRFSSLLNLPPEVITTSVEIVEKAKEADITAGRGPAGVAAAAIYLACVKHGIQKTQKDIAEVAGITEVTIRNRYKEMLEKLKLKDIEAKLNSVEEW